MKEKSVWVLIATLLLSVYDRSAAQGNEQEADLETVTEKWYKIDHLKLQYAGAIGFISPGVGIAYAKDKMETDLYFGYVPKSVGGDHLFMLTLKNTYSPFTIKPRNRDLVIHPFSIGGFFNYSFGSEFSTSWPDHYPKGYYWWDSAIRLGFFLGGKVTKPVLGLPFRSLSAYYELGSNDLYFISYVQNFRYFKPYEILNLAIGIKVAL